MISCYMNNYRLVIKKIDMILKKSKKTTSMFKKVDVVSEKQHQFFLKPMLVREK